jgi:3-deoxy-D-manno-octulosonate 8-phosphate phosphatase (KDO 8-P phosphatase)
MSNFSIPTKVIDCAKKIKVVLMDVDGVLTQGFIVYDSNGLEIKHFNVGKIVWS